MINSLPSLIRISKVLVYLKVPKHFLGTKWMTAKMHLRWYDTNCLLNIYNIYIFKFTDQSKSNCCWSNLKDMFW